MIFEYIFYIFSSKDLKLTRSVFVRASMSVWSDWNEMNIQIQLLVDRANKLSIVHFICRQKSFVSIEMNVLLAIKWHFLCARIIAWKIESIKSFKMHSKEACLWNGIVTINERRNILQLNRLVLKCHSHWNTLQLRLFFYFVVAHCCQRWHSVVRKLFARNWSNRIIQKFGFI